MTTGNALEAMDATATLQIRSHRRAHWFWCDNALIDCHAQALGPIGVALYVALARYVNHTTGQCYPSLGRLSRQLGITHLTARRATCGASSSAASLRSNPAQAIRR
jgi:hypothetical protein